MNLDEVVTGAAGLALELPLARVGGGLEACHLGLPVVAEDPSLGDLEPNLHEVRPADRDPPGSGYSATTYHP